MSLSTALLQWEHAEPYRTSRHGRRVDQVFSRIRGDC